MTESSALGELSRYHHLQDEDQEDMLMDICSAHCHTTYSHLRNRQSLKM
jgi:hypothetical protein